MKRLTVTVLLISGAIWAMSPRLTARDTPVPASAPPASAAAQTTTPATAPAAMTHPPELVALVKEFRQWRKQGGNAVPDYGAQVAAQRRGVTDFRARLQALKASAWPVHAKVDYLVLQNEIDDLDFDLNIIRQVSRNPDFYTMQAVDRVRRLIGGHRQRSPEITVPYDATRAGAIIKALNDTPAILDQAAKNLTEAVPEMADMTLDRLQDVKPHYAEFARVVSQYVPEGQRAALTAAAETAGTALQKYADWVRATKPKMTAPYAIGRPAFEWYVQHVLMLPYNSEQLLMQAENERVRNWAFLQFERQKNRGLPPLRPARTNAEFAEWLDATDVGVRNWIEQYDLMTQPDYVKSLRADAENVGVYIKPFEMLSFPKTAKPVGSQTRFLMPPDHWFSNQYYWEKNERMEPAVNHPHSEYPGHFFEGMVSQRNTCELRKGHNTRWDSWTNYTEEEQLQLNYPFLRGPRGRELMYGFAIGRAERVYCAVKFADGSLKPAELEAYMMKKVPLMDPFVAKEHEVWRKFVDPGQVLSYQVGKFQVYKLMTDRMNELGDKFNLHTFHDRLLATGQIPISLARWELAGIDDDVKSSWAPHPLPVTKPSASTSQQP